ncbi:hypothetical protein BH24CHL4_BH24CHL4_18190 [soil metagenome]
MEKLEASTTSGGARAVALPAKASVTPIANCLLPAVDTISMHLQDSPASRLVPKLPISGPRKGHIE